MLAGMANPQLLAGNRYRFSGWADGSALTDSVTTSPGGGSYTADHSYAELRQHSEDWRAGGAFGPAKDPSDDSMQAMLLALTGR